MLLVSLKLNTSSFMFLNCAELNCYVLICTMEKEGIKEYRYIKKNWFIGMYYEKEEKVY